MVLAKFAVDGRWYRARVTALLPDNHVELIYVDYGNPEVAPLGR